MEKGLLLANEKLNTEEDVKNKTNHFDHVQLVGSLGISLNLIHDYSFMSA